MKAHILTADGPKEVPLFQEPNTNLWCRKGTEDASMVRQVEGEYPYAKLKDHVVLDLGAHIGGFTAMALKHGAKKVISVEASKFTFDVLKKNIPEGATLIHAAVSSEPEVTLTGVTDGKQTGGISAHVSYRKGKPAVETVKGITLQSLITEHDPTFIKLDIEGAEYGCFPCDLSGVDEMCGELHTSSKVMRLAAFDLLKYFTNEKFFINHMKGNDHGFRLMQIKFHISGGNTAGDKNRFLPGRAQARRDTR